MGRGRVTKAERREYLKAAILETGRNCWEADGYKFTFDPEAAGFGEFLWKGRGLRLRDFEAVYLYQRLVMGKPDCATKSPHTIGLLRKRYKKKFLVEYTNQNMARKYRKRPRDGTTRKEEARLDESHRQAVLFSRSGYRQLRQKVLFGHVQISCRAAWGQGLFYVPCY